MVRNILCLLVFLFLTCHAAISQCPPLDPIVGPSQGQVCALNTGNDEYSVPNSADAGLQWTLVPPNSGNFEGSSMGETVIVDWDIPGTAQVCATPTNPCYDPPPCITVNIAPIPYVDDPPHVTVCHGDHVTYHFTGSAWTYEWTSGVAIGLPPSGTGDLDFIAQNTSNAPIASNMVVFPYQGDCLGPAENWILTVLPLPTMNTPSDVTVCAGSPVSVAFSGTAGSTFEWTNSNPAVGLAASGTGNIFFTAAQVTQQEVATVSVAPVKDGCTGAPKTFQVTVKPLPEMDAPPDVTACAGTEVNIDFTAPPGVTFSWTNSNPSVGLGPAGTGSVAFTAADWPVMQTATVTVTPALAGCAGAPRSFAITVLPAPVMSQPPDVTVCEGDSVLVVFSGTNGTSYSWQNSNPAIGLAASGSGPALDFSVANVSDTTVGVVTVTPLKGGCAGLPVTFSVTVVNCCATSAGTLDTNSIFVCGPKTVAVQHYGNHNLEPGDTIRYLLYSNPGDPTGSIVQYSDTLYFPFLQGIMHFDSAYYAAVIAGQQLPNDSIDLDGPCFSLVKGPKIVWLQKPTITVGSPPASVCRAGCVDVQFEFTGTPPFEFTWQVVQNGQVLISRNEICAGYQMIVTLCTADFTLPPADNQYMDFQVNFFRDKWCGCGD